MGDLNDHEYKVVKAMETYGGSFVKCLAQCFWSADMHNKEKLKVAFPEYWKQYEEMAARAERQGL